jgi:GNAT superfamily N-acetyltransferase
VDVKEKIFMDADHLWVCVYTQGGSLYFNSDTGYVSSLYVDPAMRGQGIGRALCAAALKWRTDNGKDGNWKFHGGTVMEDNSEIATLSSFFLSVPGHPAHGDGPAARSGGYRVWAED